MASSKRQIKRNRNKRQHKQQQHQLGNSRFLQKTNIITRRETFMHITSHKINQLMSRDSKLSKCLECLLPSTVNGFSIIFLLNPNQRAYLQMCSLNQFGQGCYFGRLRILASKIKEEKRRQEKKTMSIHWEIFPGRLARNYTARFCISQCYVLVPNTK